MRRYLPWILAAVGGLVVALLIFGLGAGSGEGGKGGRGGKRAAAEARRGAGADDPTGQGEDGVADAGGRSDGGPTRPPNKAETEQAARRERPYNGHYERVAAYWTRAGQMIKPKDAALADECGRMERYLRDQSNANEIDPQEVVGHEKELVEKIRAANPDDVELGYVLDYIRDSGNAALQNGDLDAVRKPSQRRAEAAGGK